MDGDRRSLCSARFDPSAYPHLFDAILSYASTDTLIALRQTCRALRTPARHLLFEHVVFLPSPPTSQVHILTGRPPHHYLASFRMRDANPLRDDIAALPELSRTRVLDGLPLPPGWTLSLSMPALAVLRRMYGPGPARQGGTRFPRAHRVVDYVDLSAIAAANPDIASLRLGAVRYPHQHHMLHLAWDECDPVVARMTLLAFRDTNSRTLILHPYRSRRARAGSGSGASRDGGGGGAGDGEEEGEGEGEPLPCAPLRNMLGWLRRHKVVGAERLSPANRRVVAAHNVSAKRRCSSCGTTDSDWGSDVSAPEGDTFEEPLRPTPMFETYERWAARFGSVEGPAVETMAEYYGLRSGAGRARS